MFYGFSPNRGKKGEKADGIVSVRTTAMGTDLTQTTVPINPVRGTEILLFFSFWS